MCKASVTLISDRYQLIDVIPEVRTVISPVWMKNRNLPSHHRKFVELTKGSGC